MTTQNTPSEDQKTVDLIKKIKSPDLINKMLFGKNTKWDKFLIKYYYPTKRFFSNKVYWPIYYLFRPQHSELRKVIPRSYQELDSLMVEFNFALVKSLVEKQYNGIDNLYVDYLAIPQVGGEFDKELVDRWNNFRQQLFNCYKYITGQRVKLQKELDDAHKFDLPATPEVWEKFFTDSTRIEQEIENLDNKWLVWIVNNKNYFWT